MIEGYNQMKEKELGENVIQEFLHKEESLLVCQVSSECDWSNPLFCQAVEKKEAEIILLVKVEAESTFVQCYSKSKEVRALEFVDYLLHQYGMFHGSEQMAQGEMSAVILKVCSTELGLESEFAYFLSRAKGYFQECDVVEAKTYTRIHRDLSGFYRYTKRQIPWAVVKTIDVAMEGEQLRIKTLENRTGAIVTASEDTYIMIGCRGEVYDIKRSKFVNSYIESKEALDVFEQMMDFIPAVEVVSKEEYCTIDELAKLCYPRPGNGILAKPLERRTKVFIGENKEEYFIGNEGDYLAIRCDDMEDVYIIQKGIFSDTYERVEEDK